MRIDFIIVKTSAQRGESIINAEQEEAITSSSHIRLIRWTQPVSRNRSRNTNESQ